MARKSAIPRNSLDTLIRESANPPRAPRRATRSTRSGSGRMGRMSPRPTPPKSVRSREKSPFSRNHDAIVRYAASRGVQVAGGPIESLRLLAQLTMDVREIALRQRVGMLTVVSQALASYITEAERG